MLPILASCATIAVIFNPWISHTGVNTYCLVVNFIDSDWEPRHITVGIFKASNTARATLAIIVKKLSKAYQYSTDDTKVCIGTKTVCIKEAQTNLQ